MIRIKDDRGQKAVDESKNHLDLKSLGRLKIEQLIDLESKQDVYKHTSQKTVFKRSYLGRLKLKEGSAN